MEERVSFTSRFGEKLAGTLHLPEHPIRQGVAIGHCFTCSRHTRILLTICERLSESGIAALRFDFSGNGQSEGDFEKASYSKHIGEMQDAVAYLRQSGCEWVGLAGHSMGAAIALLTGIRDDRVKAVCTLAGRYDQIQPDRLLSQLQREELMDTGRVSFTSRGRNLSLGKHFFDDAAGYNPGDAVAGAELPVLAVHGDQDEIIPVAEALRAESLNPDHVKSVIVKSADHMFSMAAHRDQVADIVTGWFREQAGRVGAT